MSIYGQIIGGSHVEAAAQETLQLWYPAYLAEVERQNGRTPGGLPQIRSWTNVADFSRWPEDALPCMVLICPGTADTPTQDGGDGTYRATWALRAAVIVSADTEEHTRDLAKLYVDATKAAVIQHQTLGGFALATDWLGENYAPLPIDKRRSLASGEVAFNVTVDGVLDRFAGPTTPPPVDPLADPGDWPTALTAEATVDRLDPDS